MRWPVGIIRDIKRRLSSEGSSWVGATWESSIN
jgi:hypothetical protein